MSPIFDKAGPVKGSSLLPIHGCRFIFNMMSDLKAGQFEDSRTSVPLAGRNARLL